jgi:hypothetical protein
MTLNPEQKGRGVSSLKKIVVVLAAGMAYYVFTRITHWGIPCVFRLLTDKYCPGCGVSRMCASLLRLDVAAAFSYNALVMVLLPFGIFFGLRRLVRYIKTGTEDMDLPEQVAVFIAFGLTVAFGILRNLPQFACLSPGG